MTAPSRSRPASRPWGAVVHSSATTLRPADPVAAALTTSAMASSFSNGVFYTVSALFFTRVVGLGVGQVGLGLTIAGAIAIAASFVAGRAADRIGAPAVLVTTTASQGLALLAYPTTTTLTTFTLVAGVAVASKAAQGAARATVLAHAFTGAERVLVRARLGVVINVFMGVGTVCGGLALLADTTVGYIMAILGSGTFVLVSVWPLLAIRSQLAARARDDEACAAVPASRSGSSPLRDRCYLAVSGLNALLAMHAGLLTVGVPLWITEHTSAPPVTVTLVLLLNTALVVAIQTPLARRIHGIRRSARAVHIAGLTLALACLVYSASATASTVIAICLLLSAAVVHTIGEVTAEIGSWGLAFDFAPRSSAGAYQGVNQASVAAGAMLAPLVITTTALTHGAIGWLVLAAVFTSAGAGTLLAVRGRQRTQGRIAGIR
ncbi:MFS transporter [Salinispora mooreana]|uniref:MFS transporter n=1 Tax=Salinispora mooreana TaxID=999545 RepID=UPI0004775E34|nr:MFS transporter [Salinispora mooreana]